MSIGGGWLEIPLPADESKKKQWYVPIFAPQMEYVKIKAQIIANDDVTITVEEVVW